MEAVWAAVGRDVPNVAVGGVLAAALRLHSRHHGRQVDRQRPSEPVDVDHAPSCPPGFKTFGRLASRVWRG